MVQPAGPVDAHEGGVHLDIGKVLAQALYKAQRVAARPQSRTSVMAKRNLPPRSEHMSRARIAVTRSVGETGAIKVSLHE